MNSSKFVRYVLVISLCAVAVPAAAQLPTPTEPWKAPLGMPAPPFGITEQAGAANYYVDNTSPAATDTSNPRGTPTKPRATVPTLLPAGSIVEVRGGPYQLKSVIWTAQGTATAPVFVKGVGSPIFSGVEGVSQLIPLGTYLIIEGIVMEHLPLVIDKNISHFAFRKSIVRYHSPTVNSAAVVAGGTDVVLYGNEIANNGDPLSTAELDIHGIKPDTGTNRLWIVDNHIHHNGGDALQIGNAVSAEPWAQYIYVGRNVMHEDRENAIDIKQARDVIVSQNLAYGYRSSSSSAGETFVSHSNPQRVWILGNFVTGSNQGIVSTGADGYFVIGNVITNIAHSPGDTTWDVNSTFRAAGILTYNTTNSVHLNNTLYKVDSGISYPSGTARTEISNNIIAGLLQPTFHIALVNSTAVASSVMSNNLVDGSARLKISGGLSGCGGFSNCINADPQFVDVANNSLDLKGTSPAVDAGLTPSSFALFQSLYGIPLSTDAKGSPRLFGKTYDIGAFEFVNAPAPPTNLRIIR
jgi:hypothetical protein